VRLTRRAAIVLLPGALLPGSLFPFAMAAPAADPPILKPKRLSPGDTVGLAAPSSGMWEREDVDWAAEVVESLGYRVREGEHVRRRDAYLAGADEQRAEDLNNLFRDDAVDAIFSLRGGYGAQRILPALDYDVIRANPKPLLGYSDITALHSAIQRRTGLVTFHGPCTGNLSDYALAEQRKVLLDPVEPPLRIGAAPPFDARPGRVERENRLTTLVGGKARGRLVGGNLTILSTLLGTPYQPDFAGKILFLEDIGEAPYRIDRMLTHLWLAGALDACAGFAIGKFTDAKPGRGSRSLEEILFERFEPLGKPALRGLMIGHVSDQTTVPVGIEAELDADAGTLTLLESAVA